MTTLTLAQLRALPGWHDVAMSVPAARRPTLDYLRHDAMRYAHRQAGLDGYEVRHADAIAFADAYGLSAAAHDHGIVPWCLPVAEAHAAWRSGRDVTDHTVRCVESERARHRDRCGTVCVPL